MLRPTAAGGDERGETQKTRLRLKSTRRLSDICQKRPVQIHQHATSGDSSQTSAHTHTFSELTQIRPEMVNTSRLVQILRLQTK